MYKLATVLKDKGRDHGIAEINFTYFSSLELVLYSWGILDLIAMEDWLHWWPNGWPLWVMLLQSGSANPPVKKLICFLIAWIWIVLWLTLAKGITEVTLYRHLKRSFCFHCFLESCTPVKTSPAHCTGEWDMWLCAPTRFLAAADQQTWKWSHPRPAGSQTTCRLFPDPWWGPAKPRPSWPYSWVNECLLF